MMSNSPADALQSNGLELLLSYDNAVQLIDNPVLSFLNRKRKLRNTLKKKHALKFALGKNWRILYGVLANDALQKMNFVGQNNPARTASSIISLSDSSTVFSRPEMYEESISHHNLHSIEELGGIYKVSLQFTMGDRIETAHYFVKRYNENSTYQRAKQNAAQLERFTNHGNRQISLLSIIESNDGFYLKDFLESNRLTIEPYIDQGITLQEKLQKATALDEKISDDKSVNSAKLALYAKAVDLLFALNHDYKSKYPSTSLFSLETVVSRFSRRGIAKVDPDWRDHLSLEEQLQFSRALQEIEKPFDAMAMLCVHGDYHGKNIVVDNAGELTLIDPERYAISNIFVDLASLVFNSDLQKEQIQALVSRAVNNYNQLIDSLPHAFQGNEQLSFEQGYTLFRRAQGFDYLQLAMSFYKKSTFVKQKEKRVQALQIGSECFTLAQLAFEEVRGTDDKSIYDTLFGIVQKLVKNNLIFVDKTETILNDKTNERLTADSGDLSSFALHSARSALGETAARAMDLEQRALSSAVSKARWKRRIRNYFAIPALVIGTVSALAFGSYSLVQKLKNDYQREQHNHELAVFRQKIMAEREQQIGMRKDPIFYGYNPEKQVARFKKSVDPMTEIRTELIYGPIDGKLSKTYQERADDLYHLSINTFNVPNSFKEYLTPVEFYAKTLSVDANLLRALLAASDWMNRIGEAPSHYVSISSGDQIYCFQPIIAKDLNYLGIGDYDTECTNDERSINLNIRTAALRIREKMEKYPGDMAKALLDFYAANYYFPNKEFLSRNDMKYRAECFEQDYWEIRLFDSQQYEKMGDSKNAWHPCALVNSDSFLGPGNFVEMTLVFYERFKTEFGPGNLSDDGVKSKVLKPLGRDFYHK